MKCYNDFFFLLLQSEPSIFTKYQTKPQLFGGDTKGGGLFPLPLPVGKSKGLLEQFEEKKKRAKDKCDRYVDLSSRQDKSSFLRETENGMSIVK